LIKTFKIKIMDKITKILPKLLSLCSDFWLKRLTLPCILLIGWAFSAVAQDNSQWDQLCNPSILCHPSYAHQGRSVVRLKAGLNSGTGFLVRNPLPGGNPFVFTVFHVLDEDESGSLEPAWAK
jgi:hypothetical protein